MNDFHKRNIKSDKLHGIEIANGQDSPRPIRSHWTTT